MKQRVVVVSSQNYPPQEEIDAALSNFDDSWKIISVATTMAPWGSWTAADYDQGRMSGLDILPGACQHLYYCTPSCWNNSVKVARRLEAVSTGNFLFYQGILTNLAKRSIVSPYLNNRIQAVSRKESAMSQARVVGYVVGSDTSQGREVWKVRSEEGEKFKVASVHGDIAMAAGLAVSFLMGTFKENGQVVRKAVDVRLLSKTREELRPKVAPSSYDCLSLVVIKDEDDEDVHVWLTDHENEQAAREWAGHFGELIAFSRFDVDDLEDDIVDFEDAVCGFHAINAISNITGVGRALEHLLTQAYELGRRAK